MALSLNRSPWVLHHQSLRVPCHLNLNLSPCVLRWLCVSLSHNPRIPHCQSPRVQCHPILMVSVSTAGRLLRVTSILSPASRDIPSPPPTLVSSQATRRFLPLIPELSDQLWHYQTGNVSRGSLPPCHPRAFVTIISHATRGSSLPSPVPSQTTEGSLPLATNCLVSTTGHQANPQCYPGDNGVIDIPLMTVKKTLLRLLTAVTRETLLRLITEVTKETLLRSTCEKDRTPLVGGDSASGGAEITCLVQYSSDAGDWHCNYFNLGYTGAQS